MNKKHIFVTDAARNVVIEECAKKLEELGYLGAAQHIRDIKSK